MAGARGGAGERVLQPDGTAFPAKRARSAMWSQLRCPELCVCSGFLAGESGSRQVRCLWKHLALGEFRAAEREARPVLAFAVPGQANQVAQRQPAKVTPARGHGRPGAQPRRGGLGTAGGLRRAAARALQSTY